MVAYRFENADIVGEYSVSSGQSISKFLEEFRQQFGTQPEISGVIVERTIDALRGADQTVTSVIDPDAAELHAPPVQLSSEFESVANEPIGTDRAARVVTDWRPTDAEFELTNRDGRAYFLHSYWWYNGSTPQMMPSGFGAEFEVNLFNDASTMGRPACAAGYKDAFWAKNYGWNWSIVRPDSQGANLTSLGAYADYNDLSDYCNRNAIAIGLRYPQNIPLVNGVHGIIIWVSAPRGTQSSSRIGGTVQAVSDSFCTSIAGSLMALTDCMGVYAGTWSSSAPQDRTTLNSGRNWVAPSKCWTSGDKGASTPQVLPYC